MPNETKQTTTETGRRTPVKKYYNFFIRTYLSVEDVLSFVRSHNTVFTKYAAICHDKDDKEAHVHVILHTKVNFTATTIQNWFDRYSYELNPFFPQQNRVEGCENTVLAYEYLTHKNNVEKFQYLESDIVSNDLAYWQKANEDKSGDSVAEATIEMLAGVPLLDLVRLYGRDFVIHYTQIRALCSDIQNQMRVSIGNPCAIDDDEVNAIALKNLIGE